MKQIHHFHRERHSPLTAPSAPSSFSGRGGHYAPASLDRWRPISRAAIAHEFDECLSVCSIARPDRVYYCGAPVSNFYRRPASNSERYS